MNKRFDTKQRLGRGGLSLRETMTERKPLPSVTERMKNNVYIFYVASPSAIIFYVIYIYMYVYTHVRTFSLLYADKCLQNLQTVISRPHIICPTRVTCPSSAK